MHSIRGATFVFFFFDFLFQRGLILLKVHLPPHSDLPMGRHLSQGGPNRFSHCFVIRFWGTNPFHLLKNCEGFTEPNLYLLAHMQ